jgi:hypothetical protein
MLADDEDNCVTHEQIEPVLDKWIADEAANEPPPAQASSLSPTSALAAPGPRRSSRKTVPVRRPQCLIILYHYFSTIKLFKHYYYVQKFNTIVRAGRLSR